MSPLWREHIQVLVSPGGLTLARLSRGLRPAVMARAVVPVGQEAGSGLPAWTAAVQMLGETLQEAAWAKADLSVVLSNHFVRYQVIPWQDDLQDESELIEYADRLMRKTYGRETARWSIQLSIDGVGRPCVASAIDGQLLDELRALAIAQDRRLLSLRPLLMEAFNWAKPWLTPAYQWLVVVEKGMICASLVGQGRWVAVRLLRARTDWPSELVAMLEREQFILDEAEAAHTVLLHVVNGEQVELPANQWTVRHVSPEPLHSVTASVVPCTH